MRILSFGGGVQSSCLLLMSRQGVIKPYDHVVFADTQCEPKAVYTWIERLQELQRIEVCTKGNLLADLLAYRRSGGINRVATIPFFTISPEGKKGLTIRQCTREYKIEVIRRHLRKNYGFMPYQMTIGISLDEAERMKPSAVKYISNEYPLVDMRMTREDCIKYLRSFGYDNPPKSACIICPFRSDPSWQYLKVTEPDSFAQAVEFDELARHWPSLIAHEGFIYKRYIPLKDATFTGKSDDDFINECEGHCGI